MKISQNILFNLERMLNQIEDQGVIEHQKEFMMRERWC